jgi:signal transduction histidine kinase
MIISPYSIPIWITVIFIASLATVTYWGSKKTSAHTFALSMYAVAIYTAVAAFFIFEKDYGLAAFGIRLTFFMSSLVSLAIYYFIKSFVEERFPGAWFNIFSSIVLGTVFYFIFYSNYLVGLPIAFKGSFKDISWVWTFSQYSYFFYILIVGYFLLGLRLLINTFRNKKDLAVKKTILYMIIGLVIGVLSPLIFNTILPQIGIYEWVWLGPTSGILWVSILGFSIVKYHQMSVRVVATEALVIAMAAAAFINIFIGDLLGVGGKIFIFVAFAVLGLYLIRSSVKELEQRQQLSDLNINLQEKVEEQTKEIRSSYQVERNAHLELEKIYEAKNQFILITQHHLRTPITSLKWQLESIISGTYGAVTPELKKAMGDMGESISRLNELIDRLLSISALRSGIETLKKEPINMKVIIDEVVDELKKEAERKHITTYMPINSEAWPLISIDKDRMREVMFIIIENAIRYNVEKGTVNINGRATENTFEVVVENTGAELTAEEKNKIFSELFYRSNQAQISHPTGMGIGLSTAKAIIEAHKGTISFGSRKDGGGARVVVTLPY